VVADEADPEEGIPDFSAGSERPYLVMLIGADGRARLTDFGIARPEDATALTQTGQVIGTRSYLAPELPRGDPATPRWNLYALGTDALGLRCGPPSAETPSSSRCVRAARKPSASP
jgi:serine/threonine protein kinase